MNTGIKALLGAALLSVVMFGCETTQTRACDSLNCGNGQCADCSDKDAKVCKEGCTKKCCADKAACTHPNSTFSCPNCKDGKHCCAKCAAKDAAACPDCAASAKACPGCKDGTQCANCKA